MRLTLNILALITIVSLIIVQIKRAALSGHCYGGTDFFKFYQSVIFYFSGQSIYSTSIVKINTEFISQGVTTIIHPWIASNGNLNPPFFTLILMPFHYLNYASSLVIWNSITIIMIIISAYVLFKEYNYTVLIITGFLLYIPNAQNLACGQLSGFLLLPLIGVWLYAREHKAIPAGILLGFLCSIKLFFGLFLIYFMIIKYYRLCFSAVISMLVCFLITGLVLGFQSYLDYYHTLHTVAWYAGSWNMSLYGFWFRLFSGAERNIPLFNQPILAQGLIMVSNLGLGGYLIWIWRKLGNHCLDIGFSLTLISMLLLSPLGWVYYFPLLIIAYKVLLLESHDFYYGVLLHVLGCMALCLSMLSGDYLIAPLIQTPQQVLVHSSLGFYGLILLLGLFSYIAIQKTKPNVNIIKSEVIAENLWLLIYGLIFLPAIYCLIKIGSLVWHS